MKPLTLACLLLGFLSFGQSEPPRRDAKFDVQAISEIKNNRLKLPRDSAAAAKNPLGLRNNRLAKLKELHLLSPLYYELEERAGKKLKVPNRNRQRVINSNVPSSSLSDEATIDFSKLEELDNFEGEVKDARGRFRRQALTYSKRPGFIWTIGRVVFETFNDTKSAFQQISKLVGDGIVNDATTRKPSKTKPTKKVAPQGKSLDVSTANNVTSSQTAKPTTTTEKPFTLTRSGLQKLIVRNLKGLIRLFNLEWSDAVKQSNQNVRDFQKSLRKSVSPFLQDNPKVFNG